MPLVPLGVRAFLIPHRRAMEISTEILLGAALGGALVVGAILVVARQLLSWAAKTLGGKLSEAFADLVGTKHERLTESDDVDDVASKGQRRPKTGALQAIVGDAVLEAIEPLHVELAEVRELAIENGTATRANGRQIRLLGAGHDSLSARQDAQSEKFAAAQTNTDMRS